VLFVLLVILVLLAIFGMPNLGLYHHNMGYMPSGIIGIILIVLVVLLLLGRL